MYLGDLCLKIHHSIPHVHTYFTICTCLQSVNHHTIPLQCMQDNTTQHTLQDAGSLDIQTAVYALSTHILHTVIEATQPHQLVHPHVTVTCCTPVWPMTPEHALKCGELTRQGWLHTIHHLCGSCVQVIKMISTNAQLHWQSTLLFTHLKHEHEEPSFKLGLFVQGFAIRLSAILRLPRCTSRVNSAYKWRQMN